MASQGEAGIFGPGHCSFTKPPDGREDRSFYHARLKDGDGWPSRKTFIQPCTRHADGTPNFGCPILAGVTLPAPAGEAAVAKN